MSYPPRIAAFLLLAMLVATTCLAADTAADSPKSVVNQGPVTLSVSVDRQLAQVAYPMQLVVEVTAPQGTRVELPRLPEQLGDFDVRGQETLRDLPTAASSDNRLWVLKATLETLKTGQLQIPALEVHFATNQQATAFESIRSKPIEIQIASVLEDRPDPTKIRDIKDTVDLPVPEQGSSAWLSIALGGIAAGVAAAIAMMLLAKPRRGIAPAAWALEQIDDLEQLLADETADTQLIYNELVDVVREYFEFEYDVPTRTRTSAEFLTEAAHTVQLGETPRRRLASLVSIADDIKFACYGVGSSQIQQAFADARAFVEECQQHREALETEKRDVA